MIKVHYVGDWKADKDYYYSQCVSHQGRYYIAVCDVPIGVTPDNYDYWMEY